MDDGNLIENQDLSKNDLYDCSNIYEVSEDENFNDDENEFFHLIYYGEKGERNHFKRAIIFHTPTTLIPPENLYNIHFDTFPPYLGYFFSNGHLCVIFDDSNDIYNPLSCEINEIHLGSSDASRFIIELAATIQFLHQKNIVIGQINFDTLYTNSKTHHCYIYKYGFPELCGNRTMRDDEEDFITIFKHFFSNTYKVLKKKHPNFLSNLSYSILSGDIILDKSVETTRKYYWDIIQGTINIGSSNPINLKKEVENFENKVMEENRQQIRQYIFKSPISDLRYILKKK